MYDPLVLVFLLLCRQPMAGRKQLLHLGILCDQAWIRSLPIDETKQFLDPQSFVGITTVYQNLRFWFVRSQVVSTLQVFLVV